MDSVNLWHYFLLSNDIIFMVNNMRVKVIDEGHEKYFSRSSWRDGYSDGGYSALSITSGFILGSLDIFNKLSLTWVPPISAITTGYLLPIIFKLNNKIFSYCHQLHQF